MNQNNLDNLKSELKSLGFSPKIIADMEKQIAKEEPAFRLQFLQNGDKGQLNYDLHFKKSAQSDIYYFNKFDVALNRGKGLEEGQKFMVITQDGKEKPSFKSFLNPYEAVAHFKEQKGNHELALGKSPGDKMSLAAMENGKISLLDKSFSKTFYVPPVSQTFYIEKGKGFTADQAANLIQGRSVYRDDLLNISGQPYKAWITLDMDKPKDRHNNYSTNQFRDPAYGFDLSGQLERYQLKEAGDPAQRGKLEEALKNGNRPVVTAVKEGQEEKLLMEAVPRYQTLNFYQLSGKPEKRESFEKTVAPENLPSKANQKEKSQEESRGMRI